MRNKVLLIDITFDPSWFSLDSPFKHPFSDCVCNSVLFSPSFGYLSCCQATTGELYICPSIHFGVNVSGDGRPALGRRRRTVTPLSVLMTRYSGVPRQPLPAVSSLSATYLRKFLARFSL
jgi:hypothetical protein